MIVVLVANGAVARAQSERAGALPFAAPATMNLPGPAAAPAGGVAVSTSRVSDDGGLRITVESAATSRLRIFAGGSPGAALVEGAATFGARYQLTRERDRGVAVYLGARYSGAGHEGRPELAASMSAQKHLGALLVCGQVEVARELVEDQRDAELGLSASRQVSERLSLGVAGQATVDLDQGRSDGGELRWALDAGPTVNVRVGRAALLVHGGAVALARPDAIRAGPFALASVAGWF
jgi:hypothetical protein